MHTMKDRGLRVLPFAACAAVILTGCLSREYVPVTRYVVSPEYSVMQAASTRDSSVAVRSLSAPQLYGQAIVYRSSEHKAGAFQGVEWAEPPRDVVTRELVDGLTAANLFRDVGYVMDQTRSDMLLSGELRRFDVVQHASGWQAVCEIRLDLRKSIEKTLVWQNTLTATVPLQSNDVVSAPPAMSQAVSEIVTTAVEEIAAAMPGA